MPARVSDGTSARRGTWDETKSTSPDFSTDSRTESQSTGNDCDSMRLAPEYGRM